ncbi:MAG: DUF3080 family protein [Algiphilus sp.]
MPKLRCLIAFALLGLYGCAPDPGDALFAGYLEMLSEAAPITGPLDLAESTILPPRYPRARARTVEVPEVRGGVLELFSLSRCDVTQFIAQRNSILGRHGDSASHVALGAAVMARLRQCRDELASEAAEDTLHSRLDTLIAEKRPALQALRWNASFGSAAFAQWWSLATQPLAPDAQRQDLAKPVEALLQAFAASRDGEVDAAQAAFSSAYQHFEQSKEGGAWLLAAQRAVFALERGQTLLVEATASGLCNNGRDDALAQAEATYRTDIAPHLLALEGAMRRTAEALERLWAAQITEGWTPSKPVADFRRAVWFGPESLATKLQALRLRHAGLWQEQQRACTG